MIPLFGRRRHPGSHTLQRMADGELVGATRERVALHLESCSRCLGRVRFYTELKEATRHIPHPSPPKNLLEEILASRERGERAILPAAPAPPPRNFPLRAAAVAAALVLAFALSLIPTSRAGAGSSELRFDPVSPAPGQLVNVEYRPSSFLAGEPTLWLRARYWTADAELDPETAAPTLRARLEREASGLYHGSVRLPPSAVYTAWVVEDATGERLDDNSERLWEILAGGGNGVPLPAALQQQFRVLEGRNWRAATETARRLVEAYPDRPEGWALLLDHELRVLTPAEMRGRLPVYHEALRRLEARVLRTSRVEAHELVHLRRLAELLGEEETAGVLRRLLDESYPAHPDAIQDRVVAITAESGDDRQRLARLEEEWRRFGSLSPALVSAGFETARRQGDPQALREWASRFERLGSIHAARAALTLARTPELREEGIERLRAVILEFRRVSDDVRPLDMSRAEFRAQMNLEARRLQAELAAALVAEGRIAEGVTEAAAASDEVWDSALFRRALETARQAGDAKAAMRYAALLAVDPWTDSSLADSLDGAFAGYPEWDEARSVANLRLRRQLAVAAPPPRPFPGGIRVVERDGTLADLAESLEGRITLVVFWHRHSWPFLQDVESLNALTRRYGQTAGGPSVLSVSVEPPGRAVEAFLRTHEMESPVVFDLDDVSASKLGVWRTPEYFVVDEAGRIRLRTSDLDLAGRVAVAVGLEAAPDGSVDP